MASPKKRRPHKRKRESELDDVEKTLIERLEQLKKKQIKMKRLHLATTLLRDPDHLLQGIACLQIEKVLVNVQFPPSHDHDPLSTCFVPPQHTSYY